MSIVVDTKLLLEEIVVFLRNNVADPKNRTNFVLSKTDNFTATPGQTDFSLSDGATLKAVSSVKIDTVEQTSGWTAYYEGTNKGKVIFDTGLTGGESVDITYKYNLTWIYPYYARNDLNLKSYPRIEVSDVTIPTSAPGGFGTNVSESDFQIEIGFRFDDQASLQEVAQFVRNLFMANRTVFNQVSHIHPSNLSPVGESLDKSKRIYEKKLTLTALREFEIL